MPTMTYALLQTQITNTLQRGDLAAARVQESIDIKSRVDRIK